ncbi:MAG: hypothetical protein M3178_06765 [Pseudomonadota bacterium]|nr:hypothetical protein [Pseudomonadota bacterium]
MKGVGTQSGVEAEAIVSLDYSKDFPHHGHGGFAGLAKFRRRISWRCSREQNPSPAWRGAATKKPNFHARHGKSRAKHEDGYLAAAPREAPK